MTIQTIRRFAVLPALVVGTALVGACDDDDDLTSPRAEVVGDFRATEATFTDNADPNTTFDVIDDDGTLDLDLREDGTFRSTLTVTGRDPVVRTGTFDVQGSNIMFTEAGATRTVPFQRSGSALLMQDANDRFDFVGAGTTVPATLDARFEPR